VRSHDSQWPIFTSLSQSPSYKVSLVFPMRRS
jgi:hypothetical protein